MNNNDLKEESIRLTGVMSKLLEDTKQELIGVNNRINELNTLLQEKEMHTDRSENASFQIAKDERDVKVTIRNLLQNRIESLESETDNYIHTGYVTIGTTVELQIVSIDGKATNISPNKFIMKLVNHDLAMASIGLMAIDSKVGSAIMNHTSGDIVEVVTPKGAIKYSIERIY